MASKKLAALAFLAAYVPALTRAQGLWYCDSTTQPDYTECDAVMATTDWSTGSLPGDPAPVADGTCLWLSKADNSGNCKIGACNNRGDGNGAPMNVFNGPTYYGLVKQHCAPNDAGGRAPEGGLTNIQAINNPDFRPSSRIRRAIAGGVELQVLSIADSEALVERARQAGGSAKLRPRQDVTWTNIGTTLSVKTDERTQLSAASGSGSTQQWSTTEGYSSTVSSSVEVGASFFDIFSASVSISVSFEHGESFTETLTFDPSGRCNPDQRAILYLYPLFDKFTGTYSDRPGEAIDWFIPVAPPNNYEIVVECLG